MAKEELARFFSEYLRPRPDVRKKIEAIPDEVGIARALVEEGRRAGFDFSEREVLDDIKAASRPEKSELSDSELQAVSGGKAGYKPRTDYMIIKMKEVSIT